MASTVVAGSAPSGRFLLGRPKRAWMLASVVALLGVLVWWVATAGAVTVLRVVYYNKTGIEDFEDFPSRSLRASSDPSGLHVPAKPTAVLPPSEVERIQRIVQGNDSVAFLVIRHDAVLFEDYYQGWTRTKPSQSFSMAKSFLSILVGAAIGEGYVESVDDVVTEYVPELGDRGFADVTIEDLLQMSSGSSYVEDENPFGIHARFTYTPNLEDEILKLTVEDARPREWTYKSGDTALLTLILDRALGPKTVTEYTQEALWSPLGMESRGLWTISDDGLEKTWCCMAATARDYAKLGQLYLQGGRFRDEQIVPHSWVERSVGRAAFVGDSVLKGHHKMMGVWSYNYHWWLVSEEDGDFMAAGHAGQFLYVNPASETIVVRLGRSQGELSQAEWIEFFRSLASPSG